MIVYYIEIVMQYKESSYGICLFLAILLLRNKTISLLLCKKHELTADDLNLEQNGFLKLINIIIQKKIY